VKERLVALTVLLVGAAIAMSAPPSVAAVAILLPLVALTLGPRLRLDRVAQTALAMGALVLGVLVPRLLVDAQNPNLDPARLSDQALLLAMPMLALAAARALVRAPVYGDGLTLVAALVALTAGGRALAGPSYPALSALAVASGLFALYAGDESRPKLRLLGARHVAAVGFGGLVAIGALIAAAWSLPRLHDAALARLMERWSRNRTGFSDQMFLGDMRGMFQSDTVVMRVRGGAPPLLRGAVFTNYVSGLWEVEGDLPGVEVVETPVEPTGGEGVVELENARKGRRYFLPLGARDVVVSTGVYERDVMRLHHPSKGFEAKRIWFREGEGPAPLDARPLDLQVPRRLRAELVAVTESWGIHGANPRARIEAMTAKLTNEYRYSLNYERLRRVDPVIDFLTRSREGHCEYFASALALLARASGIPARVVAGYRVEEVSPLGYFVVRERHAHSWVEVWLDGRWETVDPTPAAELSMSSPAQTPLFSAVLDGIATGWERVDDWFGRRSAFELSLLLVGLVGALMGARVLRARSARQGALMGEGPLPGFVALTEALSKRGVTRGPAETIAHLMDRIEADVSLSDEEKQRAMRLLRRYALVRYAGQGDGEALNREMAETARAVSASAKMRA